MVGQGGAIQNLSLAFSIRELATFSKASRLENRKPLFSTSKTTLEKVVPSLIGANGPSARRMAEEGGTVRDLTWKSCGMGLVGESVAAKGNLLTF